MSDLAYLDLNDSTLRLWHADRVVESPGYALYDGQGYQFGTQARASARLRPRDISTRFWWQLDTRPLQPALGPARHSADLVHQHLQHLHRSAGEPGEWLLAAPGSMQDAQLSLLLGIIQQCPFRAVGLVHRSVALASLFQADGPLFHLEIQLHQALLTELHAADGVMALKRETVLPGCGLLQLQERLVEAIARAFIRQTRFDPRRRAEPEQELYNALHEILLELQTQSESTLEIQGHRVRLSRAELAESCSALRDSVAGRLSEQDAGTPLLLDPMVALLPGLQQAWGGLQLDPQDLPAALAGQQARLLQGDESLVFVSELPLLGKRPLRPATGHRSESTATGSNTVAIPSGPTATHLLHGYRAKPLADRQGLDADWQLHWSGQQWQLHQLSREATLQVNGRPAQDGDLLHCGDRLQTSQGELFQLIAVGD